MAAASERDGWPSFAMAGRGRGVGQTRPAWMSGKNVDGELRVAPPLPPSTPLPSISVLGKRDSAATSDGAAALPEGWAQVSTPDGRAYWYHKTTNETTWEKPVPDVPAKKPKIEPTTIASTWREVKTEDGKTYFFNEETNQTQWERPEALSGSPAAAPEPTSVKSEPAPVEKKISPKDDTGPLAAGWHEYSAPDGSKYYSNAASGETRWDRPTASTTPEIKAPPSSTGLPANWVSSKTPEGKTYYYNRMTQQTSWTLPTQTTRPAATAASSRQSAIVAASKASNKKRGGGGGRKAAARVQRPRDDDGKALKDKQVEAFFLAEARKKARKKGVVEEDPKPILDFVEANSVFRQMLKDRGVTSDSTWLQVIRACCSDPRYLSSFRTYGLRKDGFLRFIAQEKKRQRNEEFMSLRSSRDHFLECLEEVTSNEAAGVRSLADCTESVRKEAQKDQRYIDLKNSDDKADLEEYFFSNRDRVIREQKRADRRAKMNNLRSLIEKLASEDPPQVTDDMPARKVGDLLDSRDESKSLTDVEINIVLDEWVRDSARRKAQRRAKERQEAIERERKDVAAFKEGLHTLVEQRMVHLRATWQEGKEEVMSKPWATVASLERKQEDLFCDLMSKLTSRLRDCKSKVKAAIKQKGIEIPQTVTFDEYRNMSAIAKVLDDFKLAKELEVVIFEDWKERQAERAERELNRKEDMKDDLWAFLKRKDYGSGSVWETTKAEISHRSVYRDLEAVVGEEQVKQCFLEYVAKRKKKEQRKAARAEHEERPAAPLPPPPPGLDGDGLTAELENIAERKKEILARLGE